MAWNWQQKDWPKFTYDAAKLAAYEEAYVHRSGVFLGTEKHLNKGDKTSLIIEVMSEEALKTSEIEGELLNRESVQSSIRRNFGLDFEDRKITSAEQGIGEMVHDLYETYEEPLTHECLYRWHKMLMKGNREIDVIGSYRTHEEAMRVISGRVDEPTVHFEAPPSAQMNFEMERFLAWFNETGDEGRGRLPALTRSGIAHLYFICIHPFEDGNGRIGRAISEKVLSQSIGRPTLVALSHTIQKNRNRYYDVLARNNRKLEITDWLVYFSETVLEAQAYTQKLMEFLIKKTQLYDRVRGQLNDRQEKVIARVFAEGIEGFKGGLSAEKYIKIARTSRPTATRDLQDLVNKEVLIKRGVLKGTRYYIAT